MYTYKIGQISKPDRWIFIDYENAIYEIDGFVELIKKISNDYNGKIISIGDTRYKIIGAELDLIYQYDDLFGMIIEYPDNLNIEEVITFIIAEMFMITW